jgi:hypothetical protein
MSIESEAVFPHIDSDDVGFRPGLTKLEYFAGIAWGQDEINSIKGKTVEEVSRFLGIPTTSYNYNLHNKVAVAKARVVLARALLSELEKVQP